MISILFRLLSACYFSLLSTRAILRSSGRLEQATNQKILRRGSHPRAMTFGLWRLQAKPNGTRAVKYAIQMRIFGDLILTLK